MFLIGRQPGHFFSNLSMLVCRLVRVEATLSQLSAKVSTAGGAAMVYNPTSTVAGERFAWVDASEVPWCGVGWVNISTLWAYHS